VGDLSSYSAKREKVKKRLKARGDKTDAWEKTRADLKVLFVAAGITKCELQYPKCFRNNFLSFALSKKHRYINRQQELEEVILACQVWHNRLE
jgi:hypothetical protein